MAVSINKKTELEKSISKRHYRIIILAFLTYILYLVYKPIAIITFIIMIINIKSKKLKIYEQGARGEAYAKHILSELDDSYQLFYDITVPYDNKTSQLDTIVVGDNGIFIVEVKNINGRVTGDIEDYNLTVEKTGQKGTKYYKSMYNPYKQVKTHAYRLNKYLQSFNISCSVTALVYFKCNKGILEHQNNSVNISNSQEIIFDDPDKLLKRIKSTYNNGVVKYKKEIVNKINLLN